MAHTTKVVLISCASAVATSVVVGFISFVKGKQRGLESAAAKIEQVVENNGGRVDRSAHA